MKKLLESIDSVEEGMPMAPPVPPMPQEDKGNPVSVNVSMNATGKEHVADLLDMMKNAGLGDAQPVDAKMLSPRMDMERLAGIMDDPKIPGKDDIEGDKDVKASGCSDDIDLDGEEGIEEYANEPEEQYSDHNTMVNDLSGGLNRKKKMYAKAQDGDNPMAVEGIKEQLYKALMAKMAEGRGRGKKKDKKATEGRGKLMAGRGRGKLMASRGRGKKK